jgi:transcriptional regulator of heat shock response
MHMKLKAKTKVTPEPVEHHPSQRQSQILAAIVREYANSAEPVGSAEITTKYKLKVSAATIRSEMAALERLGYIEQPHTSAGRIPTDKGYRYFVNELMRRVEISAKEQHQLKNELLELQHKYQQLGQEISRSLARLIADKTDPAAFALLPEESSTAGLSKIMMHPGMETKDVADVSEFFDTIDNHSGMMLKKYLTGTSEALIGTEISISKNLPHIPKNYSLIVSKVHLPSGKEGVIGIVGPKSMRYDKNISMLDYIAKLLSGGLLVAVLIHIK